MRNTRKSNISWHTWDLPVFWWKQNPSSDWRASSGASQPKPKSLPQTRTWPRTQSAAACSGCWKYTHPLLECVLTCHRDRTEKQIYIYVISNDTQLIIPFSSTLSGGKKNPSRLLSLGNEVLLIETRINLDKIKTLSK